MNSPIAKIDICIATYRRPGLLSKLLDSLEQQKLEPALECQIIVIDNDVAGTARDIVENFTTRSRFPVQYQIEPEKNIALARNRALACSSGEFIAFIDDDEISDPNWIQNLYTACENFEADVVFGPVLPIYLPATPPWIVKGRFFDRRRHPTASIMHDGGAGNCLLRCSVLTEHKFQFNPAFGLTGGEDSEFFHRAFAAHVKMIWCDEAIAHEHVPVERMTVRWLMLRAFRTGQSLARVRVITLSRTVRLYFFLRRLSLLPAYILALIVFLPFGRHTWVRVLRKVGGNLGYISALTKYRYREYE